MQTVFKLAVVLATSVTAVQMQTKSYSQSTIGHRVTDPVELSNFGYPQSTYSAKSYPCMFKVGTGFYDFTPFKLAQNVWPAYYINMTDAYPTIDTDPTTWVSSVEFSYQYEVGFCQLMSDADNSTCKTDSYAIGSPFNFTQWRNDSTSTPPTECNPYTGSAYKSIVASAISQEIIINETTGETQTQNGVSILYSGGPACILNSTQSNNSGAATSFEIKAWCNSSIAITDTQYSGQVSGDPCNPYIEITSSIGGCDLLQNSLIWEYLDYAKPYLGAAGIVAGFILCFYGFRLIKPSICFAGFLSCTMLSLLIFYGVYASNVGELSTFYYWMAGGAGVGIIVGVLLAYCVKVGAAILAAWGGFALGLILNTAVMFHFEYSWVFWTTNAVCMVVCAFLSFKFFDHVMISSTAVLGSYAMVRGVSCYAGHYYNEFTIINLLKSGAIDKVDPYYWGYVGGFVLFIAAGMWYQFRARPKPGVKHPYHH